MAHEHQVPWVSEQKEAMRRTLIVNVTPATRTSGTIAAIVQSKRQSANLCRYVAMTVVVAALLNNPRISVFRCWTVRCRLIVPKKKIRFSSSTISPRDVLEMRMNEHVRIISVNAELTFSFSSIEQWKKKIKSFLGKCIIHHRVNVVDSSPFGKYHRAKVLSGFYNISYVYNGKIKSSVNEKFKIAMFQQSLSF